MTDAEEYAEVYLKCGICCARLIDPPLRPPRLCLHCHKDAAPTPVPIPWVEWNGLNA